MSEDFEKLKAKLATVGQLTDEEIGAANLTDDEKLWLSAERHAKLRDKQEAITLEQYLQASKTLDTVTEGSPEFLAAQKIVEVYEMQA